MRSSSCLILLLLPIIFHCLCPTIIVTASPICTRCLNTATSTTNNKLCQPSSVTSPAITCRVKYPSKSCPINTTPCIFSVSQTSSPTITTSPPPTTTSSPTTNISPSPTNSIAPTTTPTNTTIIPTLRVLIIDWLTTPPASTQLVDVGWLAVTVNFFVGVKLFNAKNANLLPALTNIQDCPVQFDVVNFCDEGTSGRRASVAIEEYSKDIDAILGFASIAVEIGACFAEVEDSLPIVSHWATAQKLGEEEEYPMFSRVQLPDSQYAGYLADFIQTLNVTAVANLYYLLDTGPSLTTEIEIQLAARNIEQTAYYFYIQDYQSMRTAMLHIQNSDLAVIVCSAFVDDIIMLADVMAELNHFRQGGPEYLFVFSNTDIMPTFEATVLNANVSKLLHGSFAVYDGNSNAAGFEKYLSSWATYKNNTSMTDWINSKMPPRGHGSAYTQSCRNTDAQLQLGQDIWDRAETDAQTVWGRAVDSVTAMGLAACAIHAEQGDAVDFTSPQTRKELVQRIRNLNFLGLSGNVSFIPENGDRDGRNMVFTLWNWKMEDAPGKGARMSVVGMYPPYGNAWSIDPRNITLRRGSGSWAYLPSTYLLPDVDRNYMSEELRIWGYIQIAILNLASFGLMIWLIIYRRNRVVVASQPEALHILLWGVAISSWSILGLTIDESANEHSVSLPQVACMYAPFVYLFGADVALVALIGKTYRVHTVFRKNNLMRIGLSMNRLLAGVALFSFVYFMLLLAWTLSGPLEWTRYALYVNGHGQPISTLGECTAPTDTSIGFASFFIIVHMFLLIAGLIMAHSTRLMPEEFQEAQWINLALAGSTQLYVLTIAACIPVYSKSVTGRFMVMSMYVFVSNVVLLYFIFYPKIVYVQSGGVVSLLPWRRRSSGSIGSLSAGGGKGKIKLGQIPSGGGATESQLSVIESNIDDYLRMPGIRVKFEKFAESQFITESFHFICDIQSWHDLYLKQNDDWRISTSQGIRDMYISEQTLLQINIPGRVREEIEEAVITAVATSTPPPEHIFDKAFDEIIRMIRYGAWRAFVEEYNIQPNNLTQLGVGGSSSMMITTTAAAAMTAATTAAVASGKKAVAPVSPQVNDPRHSFSGRPTSSSLSGGRVITPGSPLSVVVGIGGGNNKSRVSNGTNSSAQSPGILSSSIIGDGTNTNNNQLMFGEADVVDDALEET